ncbi:RCC1 and BTB domain-containing protein 2-like isoform X2 [Rhodnius prolixus]|uniref:RCC1 and BTB domain-containing protein 2-like isoform X2 n=1 Tax=Rhodnius prolixus TaxID=13249 RepID=UPI003D18D930
MKDKIVKEPDSVAFLVNTNGDLFKVEKSTNYELVNPKASHPFEKKITFTPTKLNISNVIALASGFSHAVALDAEGVVYSWGANQLGQLGNKTQEDNYYPSRVDIPEKISKICCGYFCTFALDENLNVWFWGSLSDISPQSFQTILAPVLIMIGRSIVDISCGGRHAAMLTSDGELYMIGENDSGQIGLPNFVNAVYCQPIYNLKNIQEVVCGGTSTACLTLDGDIFCWGWLHNKDTCIPQKIPLSGKAIDICANGSNDMVSTILENNQIYYWGDDVSVREKYPLISNAKTLLDVFGNKKTPPVRLAAETNLTCLFSDDDNLQQKIAKLFNRKEYSDLKIQLKNEELYAHKFILGLQSKFLANFIMNKLKGRKRIDMREFNSESMRSYIKYLYTNEIEDIEVLNIPELYVVAIKDEKKELKDFLFKKWAEEKSNYIIQMCESAFKVF